MKRKKMIVKKIVVIAMTEIKFFPIGVVYQLYLKSDPTINYVGSTIGEPSYKTATSVLNRRICIHRRDYKNWKTGKTHCSEKNKLFSKRLDSFFIPKPGNI